MPKLTEMPTNERMHVFGDLVLIVEYRHLCVPNLMSLYQNVKSTSTEMTRKSMEITADFKKKKKNKKRKDENSSPFLLQRYRWILL